MSEETTRKGPLLMGLGAAAVASAAAVAPVQGGLLAYEGFDYTDGTSIRTQTGGTGWGAGAAWTNTGAATEIATTPGLTYQGLVVQGNKVTLTAQQNNTGANGNSAFIPRDLATSFGADGTTVWLSFIGQRTGAKSDTGGTTTSNYQRVFSLGLFNGTAEQSAIGELSGDTADVWSLIPDVTATGLANAQRTNIPIDQQSFLLLKINFVAGNDTGSLWVNPNLAAGEAGLGAAQATITDDMTFNRIRMTVGGSQNTGATLASQGLLDEIRIGDTFLDVTPIPEPAAAGLLALSGGAMLVRRRR